MRQVSFACLIGLMGMLIGCTATSPYDRGWIGRELKRTVGHDLGDPTRGPSLPPGMRDAGALSEEDAIAVALWNSAAFGAELAGLGASQADLADAGALPNP